MFFELLLIWVNCWRSYQLTGAEAGSDKKTSISSIDLGDNMVVLAQSDLSTAFQTVAYQIFFDDSGIIWNRSSGSGSRDNLQHLQLGARRLSTGQIHNGIPGISSLADCLSALCNRPSNWDWMSRMVLALSCGQPPNGQLHPAIRGSALAVQDLELHRQPRSAVIS